MSVGLRRGLANLACHLLQATLPSSLKPWGWAVRCEAASIASDTQALLFAVSSLCGLAPRALLSRLLDAFATPASSVGFRSGSEIASRLCESFMQRPRAVGGACAIGAVGLGLLYLTMAGAPDRYLAINLAALVVGLAALALHNRARTAGQPSGAAIPAMAAALLGTALLGDTMEGATRWLKLGGMSIQPSLMLLPTMLVAFARTRKPHATIGMVVAIVAIALQPDRAGASMLALGLTVFAIIRPQQHLVAASAASIAGLAVTLARPDTLPAVPYVDQIFWSSFEIHAAAGTAVLVGSAMLLVPSVVGWRRDPTNRATYATFGAVWFAAMTAAALGNYPTPLVGYGGSAIIGYALSLLALPKLSGARAGTASPSHCTSDKKLVDGPLLVGRA